VVIKLIFLKPFKSKLFYNESVNNIKLKPAFKMPKSVSKFVKDMYNFFNNLAKSEIELSKLDENNRRFPKIMSY
jgi:hypothetical protein